MTIMNSVKILAERLRTDPEEFERGNKFEEEYEDIILVAHGVKSSLWFLNEEEKELLVSTLREVKRKEFEDNVLLQVLDEPKVHTGPASVKTGFRKAQIQAEGQPVSYGT